MKTRRASDNGKHRVLSRGVNVVSEQVFETYEDWCRQHYAREGKLQQARDMVLTLARRKFGADNAQAEQTPRDIMDIERLERMNEHLLDFSTWEELLATP